MADISVSKRCARCTQEKVLEEFASGKGSHGRFGYCRSCQNEWQRKRRTVRGDAIRQQENARRSRNLQRRKGQERAAAAKRRAKPGFLEQGRAAASAKNLAKHKAAGRVWYCAICGSAYCMVFGRLRSKTCSRPCSRELRRRCCVKKEKTRKHRKRGVEAENVDPFKVFDRDGWVCQLCGVRTPKRLRGTFEDKAPELDHIVPLARGGAHSYRNTQCACRSCNRAKWDRPLGQLLLFG